MKHKDSLDSIKFITAEKNAMETSKYIESQKAKRDLFFDENNQPSQVFYTSWVEKHARKFREAWATSKCKDCANIFTCRNCLKDNCPSFFSELDSTNNSLKETKMLKDDREENLENRDLFDEENPDLFDEDEMDGDEMEMKELDFDR